jgi:uncharacterized protein
MVALISRPLVLAGLGLWIAVAVRAQAPALADGGLDIAIEKDVMIPMRDGVRLAADISRPALRGAPADGRFPVILMRTPYDKALREPEYVRLFVPNGYVVVVEDVRGRYHSEGHWHLLRDDPRDGFDTAKWVGSQPWSNGRIGTVGTSYEGGTQHAMAIAGAPYVEAMVPRNAMSDYGLYGFRHHGAFELRFLNWVFTLGNATGSPDETFAARRAADNPAAVPALADLGNHVPDYVRRLPLRPATTPLKFAPDYEGTLIEAMSHGAYDDYWKECGSSVADHVESYKDIPVYHITGWYDSWGTPVANINYVLLARSKKSLQRLIIGPWTHSRERASFAGDAQFTDDAGLDLDGLQVRWFDHWLKGVDNGVDRERPVRIYVMGGGDAHRTREGRIYVGGHWRDEREWPLARTVYTPYYLRSGGRLATSAPAGDDRPTTFTFDPRNPVPTLGGNISSQGALASAGVVDQRGKPGHWLAADPIPLSARNDIVVYQTEPLAADIEVTGRLVAKLWAASSARDTDFTVKLVDVYPPNADFPLGFDLNVADGIVRARYRNNLDHEELLEPGRPYAFEIEMYPTSLVFQRGHRIRLDVSSSNFPRFDVNSNSAEPPNDYRRWVIAENTLYSDAAHLSQLVLPVIPH